MRTEIYDRIGHGYADARRPDPRIAAAIIAELSGVDSIVNIGAGTGSYEPSDRPVVAVEPSGVMVAQRPAGRAPVVRAVAENLPFRKDSFDAAMAVLTLHHWLDWRRGVDELRRVARSKVLILTWDPEVPPFWLVERYFPEFRDTDQARFPTPATLARELGSAEVRTISIPEDCTDGFLGAYWKRPRVYLDPGVRAGISSFAEVGPEDPRLLRLANDLDDGTWERQFGHLRRLRELDIGYRLVVGHLAGPISSS